MEELSLKEMSEISGGILFELVLGMTVGSVCGVGVAAFAHKICKMLWFPQEYSQSFPPS